MISPSSLAVAALGLQCQVALIAGENSRIRCAMCGVTVTTGAPYDDLVLTDSFTNKLDMAIAGGKHVCGDCHAVMRSPDFQMSWATALVCRNGIYPVMRKENRAWAFLTPPEPPFYISIQTAKSQHVAWRAPVTMDANMIMVRVGEQIFRLRRPLLMQAREIGLRIDDFRAKVLASDGKQKKEAKINEAAESPIVSDWKMQSTGGGIQKSWYRTLVSEGVVTANEHRVISTLNPGETWALQAVLHRSPIKPDPITITHS